MPRKKLTAPPPRTDKKGRYLLEPPPEYGPAMAALVPRQRRFVETYLAQGGKHLERAYIEAGYTGDGISLRMHARALINSEKVQAALLEESRKRLVTHGPAAIETVLEVMNDPTTSKKDRLSAADRILNRGGLHARTEHIVQQTHTLDLAALTNKAKLLAAELGVDISSALPAMKALPAPAVDAQFEDIDPEADDFSDLL